MDLATVQGFVNDFFGIDVHAKKLVGELDLNYYLKAENGAEFILKIARLGEEQVNLDMQNEILMYLEKKNTSLELPRVVLNKKGESVTIIKDREGKDRFLRLLTWLPGRLWFYVNPHSEKLLKSLGQVCGTLSDALSDFDHPAAHRVHKWDISNASWVAAKLHFIEDEEQRNLADYFLKLFENVALPHLSKLRKSICYNDANDYNILVSQNIENPKVVGVIDFGDVVYTNTINELAIAIAYGVMHKPDPLSAAALIVKGYHAKFPLLEKELEVLFPMIAARLLISVTN